MEREGREGRGEGRVRGGERRGNKASSKGWEHVIHNFMSTERRKAQSDSSPIGIRTPARPFTECAYAPNNHYTQRAFPFSHLLVAITM